jgi:hypothetical protein
MKLKTLLSLILILGLNISYSQEPNVIPGQYIVTIKENAAKPVVKQQKKNANRELKLNENKEARDRNLSKIREIHQKKNIPQSVIKAEFADVLCGFVAKLNDNQVNELKNDPDVEGVYQDYLVTLSLPAPGPLPDDLRADTEYTSCAIRTAGGPINGSSKSNWIWILDTGIDGNHPDLNVQTNAPYAKSFIDGQSWTDGNSHGTHCAGIAAAKANVFGVAGVSAGAKVVPVKVLDNSGEGSWSGLISGLNHVAMYDYENDVVNLSLGAYGYTYCENYNPSLRDAIRNLASAGTWIVMAAGNNGGNAAFTLPACINGTRIYTVGSIGCSKSCSSFSNFSEYVVDWVAVGEHVYSTIPGGEYGTKTGTSMAAPVVAGIIHSRGSAPESGGTVSCKGATINIAKR